MKIRFAGTRLLHYNVMLRDQSKKIGIACLMLWAFGYEAVSAARPTSGSFDSDGVRIAYTVRGQGEPVVLVHGWLSSGWINWDLPGTSDLLAKRYRVITLDMPVHGLSDKPTKEEAYGPELVSNQANSEGFVWVGA